MKAALYLVLFLLAVTFTTKGQSVFTKKDTTQFFPLKVGNYWVFTDLYHTSKPDTIRIKDVKTICGLTAYGYGGWFLAQVNDTVFDFQSQRSQFQFSVKQFFPIVDDTQYSVMFGGDVMIHRYATRKEGLYRGYSNCYEYDDGMEVIVICEGIGIIERRNSKHHFVLTSYKLN